MPDTGTIVNQCPGCERPVEPDEDYVVALEYEVEPGFNLHQMAGGGAAIAERRFHVEHFRRRIGDRLFALVEQSPIPLK